MDFAPDCETFRGTNPRDSKTLSNGFAPNCLGMDFLSTAIKCRKIYPALPITVFEKNYLSMQIKRYFR